MRFICPLAVAVDLGRYLRTNAEVRCGKPINWSLSIALHNVSTVGEKRHWCMYCIVSAVNRNPAMGFSRKPKGLCNFFVVGLTLL